MKRRIDAQEQGFTVRGKWRKIGAEENISNHYQSSVFLKENTVDGIYSHFKKAFLKYKNDEKLWIVDFIAGCDPRIVYSGDYSPKSLRNYFRKSRDVIPRRIAFKIMSCQDQSRRVDMVNRLFILHWKPSEVIRNLKLLIDKTPITFKDAIGIKRVNTIALDLIKLVDNWFVEVQERYFFKFANTSNFDKGVESKTLKSVVEREIRELASCDSYRALKRVYGTILRSGGADKEEYEAFFRANGEIAKLRCEMEIVKKAESIRMPIEDVLDRNLEAIREKIYKSGIDFSEESTLEDMYEKTTQVLNSRVKDFLIQLRSNNP